MSDQAKCRSCRMPITWAKTARGKAMPLDPAPCEDGNVVLKGGLAVFISAADREKHKMLGYQFYRSHFATCANAKQHRKARS